MLQPSVAISRRECSDRLGIIRRSKDDGQTQAQTQTASQAEQITLGKEVVALILSKQYSTQEKASLPLTIPSNVQQQELNYCEYHHHSDDSDLCFNYPLNYEKFLRNVSLISLIGAGWSIFIETRHVGLTQSQFSQRNKQQSNLWSHHSETSSLTVTLYSMIEDVYQPVKLTSPST